MRSAGPEPSAGVNHPLAFRMAAIACINQNITIACIFGTFSVLLATVQARLGVGPELSTLGVPAVTLATAICAPFVGVLATRGSLRTILLTGSVLSTLGFTVLAFTASYPLYLLAYGLLIGPGMAAGVILPAALVTRWYVVHRGRALGIVCAPVLIALIPLVTTQVLATYGLVTTYLMLAALSAVSVVANLFIVDRPPLAHAGAAGAEAGGAHGPAGLGTVTMTELLRSPRFWALIFPFIASGTGAVILSAHMVPMVRLWGISATLAATLISIQCIVGIVGTVAFGWVADRLGGAWALVIVALVAATCWALMLLEPPFVPAAMIIGLLGLMSAGAVPALSVALSQAFGSESFSRAYGLCNLANLPFSVLGVPAAALVLTRTGSYAGAILGECLLLLATGLAVLLLAVRGEDAPAFGRRRPAFRPG